jgi:hypothetical protein
VGVEINDAPMNMIVIAIEVRSRSCDGRTDGVPKNGILEVGFATI